MTRPHPNAAGASSVEYALLVAAMVTGVVVIAAIVPRAGRWTGGAGGAPEEAAAATVLGAALERRDGGDPGVWVDPVDPARSVVISASAGTVVFDLRPMPLDVAPGAPGHDVDVRSGFPFGGAAAPIVATATPAGLAVHRLDPSSRRLVDGSVVETGAVDGVCLYHRASGNRFYAFTYGPGGRIDQWLLSAGGDGPVDAERVRRIRLDHAVEGCTVDDAHDALFVSEQGEGLWRFGADPADDGSPARIDHVGPGGLVAGVESLAVADAGEAGGYLVASSEGDETLSFYRLAGDHGLVGRFPAERRLDGCRDTHGIEIVSGPVGPSFPSGLLVCQGAGPEPTGLRLVPLEQVLRLLEP